MAFRYDGQIFIQNVIRSVEVRKRQAKEPVQIHYLHYLTWALALRKKGIGASLEGDLVHTFWETGIPRPIIENSYRAALWPFPIERIPMQAALLMS